jgi:hypothetical protein
MEVIILSYNTWDKPWEFEAFVMQALENTSERELFETIWSKAMEIENWNHADLAAGSRNTIILLQAQFQLSGEVAKNIARACAYQWK